MKDSVVTAAAARAQEFADHTDRSAAEGAEAVLPRDEPGWQADQRLLDRAWLRIGVGVAVAAQAMVFSLAINVTPAEGASYWIAHGGLLASALVVLVTLGGDLVRAAGAALAARRVSVDVLFLVTLLGALGGSLVSTFSGTGSVYYEVVSILIVVHTLGKMLAARSRLAALQAVDRTRADFAFCRVRTPTGAWVDRAVAAVGPADCVGIWPGGPICVDGVITAGRSYVQEQAMTGEWRPVARGPGERVLAGTFVVDGVLEVRPEVGPRRLDRVLEQVAAARVQPSGLQQQADRLMAWFLPLVVGVSLLTGLGWGLVVPWPQALFNAMAVLLVACPCALGLATPLAVWGGLARLARLGLVARTGDFLEILARVDTVFWDKTGTLSHAVLRVDKVIWAPAWQATGQREWLGAAVAAVEEGQTHPVARALRAWADGQARGQSLRASDTRVVAGAGVCGRVARGERASTGSAKEGGGAEVDTVEVRVGEAALHAPAVLPTKEAVAVRVPAPARAPLQAGGGPPGAGNPVQVAGASGANDPSNPTDKSEATDEPEVARKTLHVTVAGEWAASLTLAETWRAGWVEARDELQALGLRVAVLTGDPWPPKGLGVTVEGGLTPADKVARVQAAVAAGRVVLFAGDGVNDAAAFAVAHAAVAMREGSELARAAAMAVLAGDDLRAIPAAVRLGRQVVAGIRANLRFALTYNLIGMALAAAGCLHPVVAALLMVGSSAWVGARALRGLDAAEAAGAFGPSRDV